MKKIGFILCGLLFFFASACGDDEAAAKAEREANTLDSLTTVIENTHAEVDSAEEALDNSLEALENEFDFSDEEE